MTTRMNIRRDSGFSLIEILIAVVVLATGLLALTALQGRLAQASADAKVRTRVASVLTTRMDELRATQYANIPPVMPAPPTAGPASQTVQVTCANAAWVCTAQTEAGVSDLAVNQVFTRFMNVGGAFQSSGAQPADLSTAEFKRITLTATWTDATGAGKRLGISSDASPLSIGESRFLPPPNNGGAGGRAIVRQDNPAGPGVIPIAIGGGDATAASNPRPEIMGKNNNESIVGTRFDVLTYEGLSGAAVIQRRVETAVVSCKCEYGAGGDNLGEIYRTAQWPAEWTGERYEVVAPTGATVAPGDALTSKSGPVANATQSPLCTECCRDHHDAAANAVKFDPVRTGTYEHYNASLVAVGTSNGTQYIEACRLVRVDGFWRTATDMYAKHFGLINTATVNGVEAKSGAPDTTAVTNYQAYVKSYLSSYSGTAATIADATDGGQVSATINITAPPPADERYLHARGLYVDYLNQKAQDRIAKARLPANCASGDYTECMLPYLPFTTINNTELSYWEPRLSGVPNTTVLTVATASSLVYDPLQPTRGRTNAKSSATNGSTSDSTAIITRSNAGVAIAPPVDPADDTAEAIDKQNFRVVASGGSGSGQSFSVRLAGLPQTSDDSTSNDPAVAWLNATGNANCNATVKLNNPNRDLNPNDYVCATYGPLGISTTVRLASYFREYTVSQSMTHTCGTQLVTGTLDRPTFDNYAVSSAVIGGTAATTLTVANDGKTTESTDAVFASVAASDRVDVTFGAPTVIEATIASCVATQQNANKPWEFSNVVWNKPWLTP
jgi:type IV pilus modification protein PilV